MGKLSDALMPVSIPEFTFSDFWKVYPKRKGANPKATAEKKYFLATKTVDSERIINSAKAYADECRETDIIETPFVCQAATWLNQKRYEDYAPDPGSKERTAKIAEDMKKRGWEWSGQKWEKIEGDHS